MFTSIKRIFQIAIMILKRQGLATFAMIFVIAITCLQVSSMFLLGKISQSLILDLEEKVDISVYLKMGTSEEDIFSIKEKLSQAPQVKKIEYISSEEAREIFIERHKDDLLLMESLVQVGNPFLASLNIKAFMPDHYEEIANLLENSSFKDLVEKVDYYQRKPVIERIFAITSGINKGLLFLSLVLGSLTILITFNTIRLATYSLREEIEIERLVGASDWFIRGPFLLQGGISGLLAFLISLSILSIACFFLTPQFKALFPDLSLFSCFGENFFSILLIQFLTGTGLGVFSSFIATRKYLKI